MPHFLLTATYTADGMRRVREEGAAPRIAIVEQMFKSLGGRLEVAYWAFGQADFVAIGELPDNAAAAAAASSVTAAGASSIQTTVLLTAAEVDEAIERTAEYRAPGHA